MSVIIHKLECLNKHQDVHVSACYCSRDLTLTHYLKVLEAQIRLSFKN